MPSAAAGALSRVAARVPGWVRTHPYTLAGVLLFVGLAGPFLLRRESEWDQVFVRAAEHLRAGGDVYNVHDGYSYPPFMAWLAVPFTYLPPLASRAVWYLINAAALVVLVRCAWRGSGGGRLEGPGVAWQEHLICGLGLACTFRYALNAISHQQTDLVVSALVLAGCLALLRERSGWAATAFGLAAAMKCTALLWSPYLLWRRRWQAGLWVAVVAVGVNLLPNLVSTPASGGWWLTQWWSRYLQPMAGASYYPGLWCSAALYNQSLAGLGFRWLTTDWAWTAAGFEVLPRTPPLGPRTFKLLVYGGELLLLGAMAAVLGWRRPEPEVPGAARPSRAALEGSLVLLLMVLLSPMSSKPHFSTLFLPGFCLARLALTQRDHLLAGLLAGPVLWGLAMRELTGPHLGSVAMWYGAVTWSALLLLVGCGYAHWRYQGRQAAVAGTAAAPSLGQAA